MRSPLGEPVRLTGFLTMSGSFAMASRSELLHVWRLPRERDKDLLELVRAEMTKTGLGKLFGLRAPSIHAALRQVGRRLKILDRAPELRIPVRDRRATLQELRRAGFTTSQARYLWALYWTTSPAAALKKVPVANARGLVRRFLSTTYQQAQLRRLQAAIKRIRRERYGCLWGRMGITEKPGTKGHRRVEDIAQIRAL